MAGEIDWPTPNEDDIGQLSADLVGERFANAQAYAETAYNSALGYIGDMEALAGISTPTVNTDIQIEVQDVNTDFNTIEKPTAPDTSMVQYSAPNSPLIEDVTVDAFSEIPGFDVPTLSITLPTQPDVMDIADPGEPDPISNPEFPAKPVYTLPALPTLKEAVVPDPPSLTMPAFEGSMPVDDLIAPTNTFNFQETLYSSTLLEAAKTKLENDVENGGTGLGAAVEDGIWTREQERAELALQEAKERATGEWAEAGFELADGVLTTILLNLETDYTNARYTSSRDIATKQAELALQNTQWSLQQSVALEGQLMNYSSQVAQRQLDAAKALIDASIAIFNANVTKYNAKIEGYKAQAVVYEAKIRGALAQAEIYKTQIEAAKLTLDMDMALVELYKAQLAGVEQLINCYRAEMEGARVKADVERLKLEAFKAKVDAYVAKTNLNVAEYNMYESAIKGEEAKTRMYATQVEAYKSRVEAVKLEADVAIEKAKIEGELQKIKAAIYESDINAFKGKIEAEKVRVEAIVNTYQGEVEAFKSETQAEGIRVDAVVKAFAAKVEQAVKVAELYLKEAEVQLKAYTDQMNLKGELVKAGAQVASQLAASAMSSVNASAHIGETDSKSKSYGTTNTKSVGSSTTSSHTETHSSSTEDKTQLGTFYNYNYTGAAPK